MTLGISSLSLKCLGGCLANISQRQGPMQEFVCYEQGWSWFSWSFMGWPEGFSVLTQLTFTGSSLVAAKQGKRQSYEFLKCLIV